MERRYVLVTLIRTCGGGGGCWVLVVVVVVVVVLCVCVFWGSVLAILIIALNS